MDKLASLSGKLNSERDCVCGKFFIYVYNLVLATNHLGNKVVVVDLFMIRKKKRKEKNEPKETEKKKKRGKGTNLAIFSLGHLQKVTDLSLSELISSKLCENLSELLLGNKSRHVRVEALESLR